MTREWLLARRIRCACYVLLAVLLPTVLLPTAPANAASPCCTLVSDLNYLCLDIKDMNPTNGAQIQMWDCWNGSGQLWYWDGQMLRSQLNYKCLDIKDVNPTNGAMLQMWDCWNGAGQRWYWDHGMLRSELNFKCIDIKDVNASRGALVQMWDCWNGAGQRWIAPWWFA